MQKNSAAKVQDMYPLVPSWWGGVTKSAPGGPASIHIVVFIPCLVAALGPALEPKRARSARVVLVYIYIQSAEGREARALGPESGFQERGARGILPVAFCIGFALLPLSGFWTQQVA